ncbi:hypothetical protein BU25DRAFT_409333 [Macroventuria anomochaeta]|uniref:Uncharacterized protein n=1 Tax=Macroventuria anomochaeta TaxID=301207 RepID=A0ACB6S8I8_9PLEO|nr:uncharacterized protein BU25DRAFT_409333 [Macroventuria anomochaeta]KAF2629452.1 hypothetical protein BU25DRAFT_409333 [Macroventuria anomochaeta]
MALSGAVHAAVHTVECLETPFLPRDGTLSGPDNVHRNKDCAMCCHGSLINHGSPWKGVMFHNVADPETRLISSSSATGPSEMCEGTVQG